MRYLWLIRLFPICYRNIVTSVSVNEKAVLFVLSSGEDGVPLDASDLEDCACATLTWLVSETPAFCRCTAPFRKLSSSVSSNVFPTLQLHCRLSNHLPVPVCALPFSKSWLSLNIIISIIIIIIILIIIDSNSLYCIYFGASWIRFSLITFPNRTSLDEIWNISERPWCALTQEKWGKSPQGFRPRMPKRVLFFLLSRQRGLSATYPAPIFWNNRRESLFACVHRWQNFQFLRRGFSRSQNSPKYVTLG